MSSLIDVIINPVNIVTALVFIAAFGTVAAMIMPFFAGERLNSRMKYVSSERDKLRLERLDNLADEQRLSSLRREPKSFMKHVVEQLNIRKALETDEMRHKLKMAGFRGQAPVVAFLFFRASLPFAGFALVLLYLFFINDFGLTALVRVGLAFGGAYLGFYLPNIFVSNLIQRRQKSIKGAFPDALDLLLISVQAGMSVEAAMNKVANEIGSRSIELAEEFSLTTAELSYLPERRQAFDNLGKRTGLASVRAVGTSLIQAERYGTAVAESLRVLAQEGRDMRMSELEKKAAALPPKLTVPMIVFFLPVLFIVILGPAAIQLIAQFY